MGQQEGEGMTPSTQKAFAKFEKGYDRSCLWEAYRHAGPIYARLYEVEMGDSMCV